MGAGRLREQLVWVGTDDVTPRGASYVAPQAQLVKAAMQDLVRFCQRRDLPAIIHAAVADSQFEAIHPFEDGNGRTGRTLIQVMLHQSGALEVTAPIIDVFVDSVRFAVTVGWGLVDELRDILEEIRERLAGVREDSAVWRVVPLLVSYPAISLPVVVHKLGVGNVTGLRAMDTLVQRGIVQEVSGKKRNRVWVQEDAVDALREFWEKIRRAAL